MEGHFNKIKQMAVIIEVELLSLLEQNVIKLFHRNKKLNYEVNGLKDEWHDIRKNMNLMWDAKSQSISHW